MKSVRIALIGAGSMATTFHYPSLADCEGIELVGVCDLVEAKRKAIAERLGIARQYSDYQAMLEETNPDAVYILMAPHLLFDMTIQSLKRGLHVFIEKPPGVSTFQTESMARTASEHGCITMVGFNRRHDPLINRALDRAREVGRVNQVQATFFKGQTAIYFDGCMDVLACDGIHAVDTLRYLADGEVKQVLSTVARNDSPVPNAWNALVVFDNGVVGVLQSNWSTGGRMHCFEIHSQGYSAYVEQLTSLDEITSRGRETRTAAEVIGAEATDPRKLNGFYQQAEHFVECIRDGKQPSSNFADACKTMRLVDQIREGYVVEPPG